MGFWNRLAQLNAPFVAASLRKIADQVEAIFPGRPAWAIPIIFNNEGEYFMASIEVRDSDGPLTGTVTFLDAKGAVTAPDDVPAWASDNEDAATVVASEDGLTGVVTIGGPGAAIISVTSTDTDGTEISAQGTVTVLAGEAVSGSVDFAPAA